MGDTDSKVVNAAKASVAELQAARPELVILDKRPTEEVREAFGERVGKLDVDDDVKGSIRKVMGASEDEIHDQLELAAYRLHFAEIPDDAREAATEMLKAQASKYGASLPEVLSTQESDDPAEPAKPDPDDNSPDPEGEGDDGELSPEAQRLNYLEGKDAATEAIEALSGVSDKYRAQLKAETLELLEDGDLRGREAVTAHIQRQAKRDKAASEALVVEDPSPKGAGPTDPETSQGSDPHPAAGQWFGGPRKEASQ